MGLDKRQQEIVDLETRFWDSIVDGRPEVATGMLTEPALMVSSHGASKFDHAGYRRMASDERYKLLEYAMSDIDVVFPREDVAVATYHVAQTMEMEGEPLRMDVFDTSTWLRIDGEWRCVMHTESPEQNKAH